MPDPTGNHFPPPLAVSLLLAGLAGTAGTAAAEHPELYPAEQDGEWGLIDRDGEWVVSPRFEQLESFSEGRGIAFDGEKFGIIDAAGEWVAEPEFRSAGRVTALETFTYRESPLTPFREGYTTYCWNPRPNVDAGCHLVDRDGQARLEDQDHAELGRVSEGLVAYQPDDGLRSPWGFLDTDGEVVIEAQFHEVGPFVDGLAPAAADRNEWGFIDTDGEWVIEPEFRETTPFSDGLAAVEIGSWHWAYIDREGEIVLDEGYRDASPFDQGIALVTDDDTRAERFIDTDGRTALSAVLERDDLCTILPYRDGLAPALIHASDGSGCGPAVDTNKEHRKMFAENAVMAYFDTDGEIVWRADD
ncbi:WG repeat-containing protein [Thioalkalivibrio sp. ALJ24]|uniref:WG repeat-containing protein n=1 Tax=Thioalkalivibrio sp. ALJ24 TaxID=545276 RepID=UPI0003689D55|nr:WG repeat-containing protein [Thioalkalivibrio sp. ALJ24]